MAKKKSGQRTKSGRLSRSPHPFERSPSGRACGPSDLSQSSLSQPEALVPNAPLYFIGPYSIEWSTDLVNFHHIQFDSFGEYASYCHANGKK